MPLTQVSLVVLADSFSPQSYTSEALREVVGPDAADILATPVATQVLSPTGLNMTVVPNKLIVQTQVTEAKPPRDAISYVYGILEFILNSNRLIQRQALGLNLVGFEAVEVPDVRLIPRFLNAEVIERAVGEAISDASFTVTYNRGGATCRLIVRPKMARDGHVGCGADLNVHFAVSDLGQMLEHARSQAEWAEHFQRVLAVIAEEAAR